MKRRFAVLPGVLLWMLPRLSWASDRCPDCVLGIWDDPALSRNIGEIVPGQPKDVYVGIKFAGRFDRSTGISFSITGLGAILIAGFEPIVPTSLGCDYVGAPTDTTLGSGGCSVRWPGCLVGDQALVRITLLTMSPVTNVVLRVRRQYPSPDPTAPAPFFTQCNAPSYTPTGVRGGYYILNWNGDPGVPIDRKPWSVVKYLFR